MSSSAGAASAAAAGASQGGSGGATLLPSSTVTMTPLQWKALSRGRKVEALRDFRSKPSRNPTVVALLAADVLAGGSSGLGDELYTILEQYVIASLDLGNQDAASKSLAQLTKTFGASSVRVRKLYGLLAESVGEQNKARDIYASILKDVPSDAMSVKRLAAIRKSEGDYQGAVDVLENQQVYKDEEGNGQRLLAVHNADETLYRELLNLHYALRKWERCMYYAEETILMNPYSFLNHVRHAEVCYLAKEYERSAAAYAHALTINDGSNNCRAAYGLLLVASELAKQKSNNNVEEARSLRQWASAKLRTFYQGSPLYAMLDMMLQGKD